MCFLTSHWADDCAFPDANIPAWPKSYANNNRYSVCLCNFDVNCSFVFSLVLLSAHKRFLWVSLLKDTPFHSAFCALNRLQLNSWTAVQMVRTQQLPCLENRGRFLTLQAWIGIFPLNMGGLVELQTLIWVEVESGWGRFSWRETNNRDGCECYSLTKLILLWGFIKASNPQREG